MSSPRFHFFRPPGAGERKGMAAGSLPRRSPGRRAYALNAPEVTPRMNGCVA